MFAALLATSLFCVSAITATRTARLLGGTEANFWRLSFAAVLLGILAHTFGGGLGGVAFPLFLLSGVAGFGIGDVALFQALPALGSRLSILLVHCIAAPVAAACEWLWLGTRLGTPEILAAAAILVGVALALAPGTQAHPAATGRPFVIGVLWGVVAACGQGFGAVLSRKAFALAAEAGESPDGITAAWQRIIAGVLFSGICLLIVKRHWIGRHVGAGATDGEPDLVPDARAKWRGAAGWIAFNAIAGPTLGVACYQWALRDTPSGIVLPIVALAPLLIIPLTARWEGERPTARSLLGGVIAVAGAVALALAKSKAG